jgi:putative endonuclease
LGESKGIPVYYCYILCCADDSFYVGVTDDLAQRVRDHNEGRGASWTAARRPARLVWTEEHPTLSAARTRENQLKRWSREKKDVLVRASPRLRSGQGA